MSKSLYKSFWAFCLILLLTFACRQQDDHYIYGLQDQEIEAVQGEKRQLKSMGQYIAVLYTNIFQRGISPTELQEIESAMASLGDKTLARRMVISNFLRKTGAHVPSMEEMREDVDAFVQDTYVRFLIRNPTQAELIYLRNFIESRPQLEPHIIYTTFALSDEYQFY